MVPDRISVFQLSKAKTRTGLFCLWCSLKSVVWNPCTSTYWCRPCDRSPSFPFLRILPLYRTLVLVLLTPCQGQVLLHSQAASNTHHTPTQNHIQKFETIHTALFLGSEISSMYSPKRSLNSFCSMHLAICCISLLVTLMSSIPPPWSPGLDLSNICFYLVKYILLFIFTIV